MAQEEVKFRAGTGEETRHIKALGHQSFFIPCREVSTVFHFFFPTF